MVPVQQFDSVIVWKYLLCLYSITLGFLSAMLVSNLSITSKHKSQGEGIIYQFGVHWVSIETGTDSIGTSTGCTGTDKLAMGVWDWWYWLWYRQYWHYNSWYQWKWHWYWLWHYWYLYWRCGTDITGTNTAGATLVLTVFAIQNVTDLLVNLLTRKVLQMPIHKKMPY